MAHEEQKTLYFVNKSGEYVGAFCGVEPPAGSVEVPFPPEDARQKWNGKGYDSPEINYSEARQAAYKSAEAAGELPASVYDHIDLIYTELANSGINLSEKMQAVLQKRQEIKNTYKK